MHNDIDHLMKITTRPPVVMVEGSGSWLRDSEGREYLDFVQGWAVNCLGHSHPVVVEALRAQAGKLINCSPAYYNERMARLATLVSQSTGLDQVFLCNSGAEANEGAIKLARKWGQRFRSGAFEIVTTQGAFHGRTLATMSASGKPAFEPLFEPKVPGFRKVPLNDLAAMDAAITERTAAIMLEPIQGEAGVIPADDDYLKALRALTRERGVLLILDEIQTGVGRTGRFCAYEHVSVQPDILTLGKGLGAGVPLAALVASAEVCCFEPGDQGGTFNGNPLMAAVGCAVVETVGRPEFLAGVREIGDYLTARLQTLSADTGHGAVRGRGLLLALALNGVDAAKVADTALERGLLINAPRPDSLRFMPALTVTRGEIDRMVALLEGALA
ncbi:MAG: acetylornithine transaminase [Candidatus Rokuibacteriota bacterium]|jgi:acetylornithine/N-succinyldiaminopimelate aminotransferase|nr:acetylornithine transaminase [Patescibacteria group bacterium]